MLLFTFGRLSDAKVSGVQAASDKGADGRLELARRDVRKLYSLKLNGAELERCCNHDCSKWASRL